MNPDINNPSFLLQVTDPEDEVCDWLDNNIPANEISSQMLRSWLKIDERRKPEASVPPEVRDYRFCSSDLAMELNSFELNFSDEALLKLFATNELSNIRRKYNPFEGIGKSDFRSRITVKAANMDYLIKYTEPLDQQGNSLIDNADEGLCYSDIYGDADGFVEYIEWRKRGQNKKTTKLNLSSNYRNSDGVFQIYDPLHMERFIEYVRDSAIGARLHLLCVDFYKEGIHFCKPEGSDITSEVFFKHSTLSYCLLALTLLRPNGTFIMKIYETEVLFTVGLLYLMYRCFDKISLVKPTSCRRDQSEGYLICKWKKPGDQTEIVRQYLCEVNMKLNDVKDTDLDVIQLVPFEVLKEDKAFFEYVCERNDKMIRICLQWLECVKLNFESNWFYDPRKVDFKQRCCHLWDIPERANYRIQNFRAPISAPVDNWRRKDNEGAHSSTNIRYTAQSSYKNLDTWRRRDYNFAAPEGKDHKIDNWRKRNE